MGHGPSSRSMEASDRNGSTPADISRTTKWPCYPIPAIARRRPEVLPGLFWAFHRDQPCHSALVAGSPHCWDCEKPSNLIWGRRNERVGVPVQRAPGAAVSAKVHRPRQGRFDFGNETAHDFGHREDFLDAAHGLPGSKQSLVRPAALVRRQYLAPQSIAVAACLLTFPAPCNRAILPAGMFKAS